MVSEFDLSCSSEPSSQSHSQESQRRKCKYQGKVSTVQKHCRFDSNYRNYRTICSTFRITELLAPSFFFQISLKTKTTQVSLEALMARIKRKEAEIKNGGAQPRNQIFFIFFCQDFFTLAKIFTLSIICHLFYERQDFHSFYCGPELYFLFLQDQKRGAQPRNQIFIFVKVVKNFLRWPRFFTLAIICHNFFFGEGQDLKHSFLQNLSSFLISCEGQDFHSFFFGQDLQHSFLQ